MNTRFRSLAPALLLVPLALPARAQLAAHESIAPTPLVEATLTQLQDGLQLKRFTSEELVTAYLARIAAYDDGFPFLNGVRALNPAALDDARASDRERALGHAHGPLFGIPVLVKDNIDVAGLPTTAGSLALENSFPSDDAFLVRRLRAAGAIVLGKTTLTEFANFMTLNMPSGYSSLGGFGFNPYDPRPAPGGDGRPVLTPGGSSSGSGITVAANLVAVAVGTETSGSILSPASSNGCVGIKPTLGLISRDGILPISADQDTAGPIARTVTDAAILLGVLAGYDPADPATEPCRERGLVPVDYRRFLDKHALEGARIAVPHNPYWTFVPSGHRQRMAEAIVVLEAEGAFVDNPHELPRQGQMNARGIAVTYPPPAGTSSVLLYTFKRDLNAYLAALGPSAPRHNLTEILAFNDGIPDLALHYGQSILRAANAMNLGATSTDTQRYVTDRARDLELFRGSLDELFNGPDMLPDTGDEFDAILFPGNVGADAPARAGYPSITVPGEFMDPAGAVVGPRPAGITFTGPAFSEPRLIGLAFDFEQATKHRLPPESAPELPGGGLGH